MLMDIISSAICRALVGRWGCFENGLIRTFCKKHLELCGEKNACVVTWISLAWYMIIRPRRMIVERLIRHFRAKEYSDSCKQERKQFRLVCVHERKGCRSYHIRTNAVKFNLLWYTEHNNALFQFEVTKKLHSFFKATWHFWHLTPYRWGQNKCLSHLVIKPNTVFKLCIHNTFMIYLSCV